VTASRTALLGWLVPLGIMAAAVRPLPPVAVDVSPRLALSGSALRVRVTVEPHEANRLLRTQVDTLEGTFFKAWDEDLSGARAPRTRTELFDQLPEGHYIVSAQVARADGSTTSVATAEACKGGITVSCTTPEGD
jgi:hypothetical protein